MTSTDDPVFVGRATELAALRSILDDVRAGHPRIVILEGPPGIGKTTLVDRFLSGQSGVRVLRATGEQWETLLPYGLLDQLARAGGTAGSRLLLDGNLALSSEDSITVGARVLQMWSDYQDDQVVVTIIDDAHWSDADSLRALLFAIRRLDTDKVLVILATRELDSLRMPEGLRRIADGPMGSVVRLGPLAAPEVQELALRLGTSRLPTRAAQRLHEHTQGNPLYLRAVLAEVSRDAWWDWEPTLPAPRAFSVGIIRKLRALTPSVRSFVEAASVLGVHFDLQIASRLSKASDPLPVLDTAVAAGLLRVPGSAIQGVKFPHPMVQAAVYEQLSHSRRAGLHRAAAVLVDDEPEALRHRVAAASGPEPELVADLEAFAAREAARGAWASAASTLAVTSGLSPTKAAREVLLTRAVDAMVAAGDVVRARPYAAEIMGFPPSALRDATLGHLAVLTGDPAEAENRLRMAWRSVDLADNRRLQARIAQRNALHAMGRLRPLDMVEWAQQAVTLAEPDQPERADASSMLGVSLALLGRTDEGLRVQESAMAGLSDPATSGGLALRMGHGWLRMVDDEILGAATEFSEAAPAALHTGSYRVAVYSFAWLARCRYYLGAWDEAIVDADRALALLAETEHEWLRPLVHWVAGAVPAARGDWEAAAHHARAATAGASSYELMTVTDGMAKAQLAAAQGDHDAVLRALEPVLGVMPREAVEEPGFWPWQDLYADALVSVGRLEEADAFLRPREELAERRQHRSTIARLCRARGRLEAAAGRIDLSNAAFDRGLRQVEHHPLPFDQAQLELAWGRALRRDGQRRAAAGRLRAASDIFTALRARPLLEHCERELLACGLTPARRRDFDANRLTPHELAVANLVVRGMSNRQVASEIMISVKTVQAHLTRIYAKMGVTSRSELAAQMRDSRPEPDFSTQAPTPHDR